MNAVEIYDISTGDVLGISRKIHLYGIDPYFPFFVSFFGPDGAATYPHDSPYKERHTAALMKEIFPNYSGFTNY